MREFRAKAIINAAASEVFKVLITAECYPKFDPNCEKIDGIIMLGKRISVYSKSKPNRVSVVVSQITDNEIMTWELGLPFQLLKRVRTFKVIAKDDQTTEFHLSETQSGYLLGILTRRLPDQGFLLQEFAKGLKKYIESRP